MRRSPGVLASLASIALLLGALAPAALAAGPERIVIDLDDPQLDADESAFWSAECGYAVSADNRGHITGLVFGGGRRSILEIWVYNIRATYTNVETGTSATVYDDGPDRFFLRNGMAYVGVTGRSTTGTGTIGVIVFDLATDEIVHQAGRDVGVFFNTLCDTLAA
jgi:hypothetical protein